MKEGRKPHRTGGRKSTEDKHDAGDIHGGRQKFKNPQKGAKGGCRKRPSPKYRKHGFFGGIIPRPGFAF